MFLPIIDDTCPRCVIEAKLLGLDIITNVNSQHTTEGWWHSTRDDIKEYLEQRPKHFWSVIDGILA